MAHSYAGILGIMAFATVLLQGLLHGAAADATLASALTCLLAFAAWGFVAGQIAASTVSQSVRARVWEELRARKEKEEAAR
jgi:hypothetical protein